MFMYGYQFIHVYVWLSVYSCVVRVYFFAGVCVCVFVIVIVYMCVCVSVCECVCVCGCLGEGLCVGLQ